MNFHSLVESLVNASKAWYVARGVDNPQNVETSFRRTTTLVLEEGMPTEHYHLSGLFMPTASAHATIELEKAKQEAILAFNALADAMDTLPHLNGVGLNATIQLNKTRTPKLRLLIGNVPLQGAPRPGHVWTNTAKRLDRTIHALNTLTTLCDTPKTAWWSFDAYEGLVRASTPGEALTVLDIIRAGGVFNKKKPLYHPPVVQRYFHHEAEQACQDLLKQL